LAAEKSTQENKRISEHKALIRLKYRMEINAIVKFRGGGWKSIWKIRDWNHTDRIAGMANAGPNEERYHDLYGLTGIVTENL